MAIFGIGKKDEDDFDEEDGFTEEEELNDRKLTRKFKDLAPENKKKRKEPPKPWGKKERYIVLGFFLTTTLLAMGMFLFSHDFKFPGLPKISFKGIDFQNPFGEEVIEIGQKGSAPKDDAKAESAISQFKKDISPLSGLYGFLAIRLEGGTSYGVSSDQKFQGVSVLKLPLMVLVYKMSESGSLNLDTKYTLKDTDKVKGSGIMSTANAGTVYTYRKLVELMGKNSDRTAYKVMKDVVSEDTLKKFVYEVGMTSTDISTGNTSPHDIGLLLQKLWNGSIVNQTSRDEILGYLTNTMYENWITKGVPTNIKVAHKIGQDAGVAADGGIILSNNPYILIIMGQGINQNDPDILFPKVSKDIYNVENSVK